MAGQGRNCQICSSSQLTKKASRLIAEGVPDGKVADALWPGLTGKDATAARMRVQRHRTQHIQKPAQAIVRATAKAAGDQPASPEQPPPVNPKCRICADPALAAAFTEHLAAGMSDQAIANKLGLPNRKRRGRTTPTAARQIIQRHRTRCILAPAKALVEAADKGHAVATERKQVVAAAEAGIVGPDGFLTLAGIVADMKATSARLERVAQAAEDAGQNNAVAALAGQQIRAAETRAKLGAVGSYAPQKGGDAEAMTFTVNFLFGNGQTETFKTVVGKPVVEHEALPEPDEEALAFNVLDELLSDG